MFEPNQKEGFAEREERVLAFWQQRKVFEQSMERRKGREIFSFYDGPPFATGLPHYGHLLAGTLKDVIPRYQTMKGRCVPRRFGWDCHGLPVENEIEKAKALSGAASIEAFGVAAFNEECRGIVLRYTEEWKRTVRRMGRWVSFEDTYRTMDRSFMESVWWAFGQLYDRGLIYEGFKVMPFSAKLGTPLSNFEANLNYKEVDDPSLTVMFELVDEPNVFLLVWTTTPWTLPSNLAILARGDMEYVRVEEKGRQFILAKGRVRHYFKEGEYRVVGHVPGTQLEHRRYKPLFPYFAARAQNKAFRVILEEGVMAEEGTGFVHAAPAFGEVDFFACAREGIEVVCPVDHNGQFTEEVPDFQGQYVKDADREIIKRLKLENKVFHHTQIHHRYPFCWRSDTPLIYRAVRTWFVAVDQVKEKMLKANAQIRWVPEHIKGGRFGKWLENARDWAISRNRYWGTPIPIWRSESGDIKVIRSARELEEKTGQTIADLHRHFIDELTFEEGGQVYRRIPEVFDCWFESGSMPYAQEHYPFERKEVFEQAFPADFIAEGLDQTRGWFYTLTVLAAALFDQPAFKNVIVNGIILAENGMKMSKRLKNYPEPDVVLNRYGADAVRLYLLGSPAVHAEDLRFSEKGVELVMRQVLIPLWNAFVFLSTYAKIYHWHPSGERYPRPKEEIDRWILSRAQKLTQEMTEALDGYQLNLVVAPLVEFVDLLTNWYIRRNRDRFWSEIGSRNRDEAFETLYIVLMTLVKLAAPVIPFLTEEIYQHLKRAQDLESVHLHDFPVYEQAYRDEKLESEMQWVQTIVSLGHGLRKEHKLKVRQPLARAHVITADQEMFEALARQKQLIGDELNVKKVELVQNEEAFVRLIAKPNFRVLGKKVGDQMKAVQKRIEAFSQAELIALMQGRPVSVVVGEVTVVLTEEDVSVERKVKEGLIAATEGAVTVALNTALSEDLLMEGLARELVNKINTMRRDMGFAVVDRIVIRMRTTDRVKLAFAQHKDYIMHEVLGVEVFFDCGEGTEWDLNGEMTVLSIGSAL